MQFLGSEAFEAGEEMMVSVPQLVDMATKLWFTKERFFMRVCSEEPLDFLLFDCELCAEKTCKNLLTFWFEVLKWRIIFLRYFFLVISRFYKLIKWREGDLSLSSELQLSSLESSGGSQPLLRRGLAIMNFTAINVVIL